ncbi:GTP-dependent dephospho-CoA kinase family protein [Halolamina sediminis]|uniref:GTP-dependent dephospho-CoA kinase family protein n=1 Tax=Halolamina sediminis TaxID=1480675 RepID=UPI0006B667A8|nr:GTP-dependent dephospho-CoA kinase family protein [Halolamina sediminis]
MLTLPPELREAFKEPFGPLFTDVESLLAEAEPPIIAVGDMVTYHLRQAGHEPHVSVVDGLTERAAIPDDVREALEDAGEHRTEVVNEPAELSRELLLALREAVDAEADTLLVVEGEEDLATLPAVLAAPLGGSVVYGQPGEGMVLIRVTEAARAEMRDLLVRFDGDADAALAALSV